jgi:hypothetical protein
VADPVPEPEPPKRPVLSPDPDQIWRPAPRRQVRDTSERRPFWRLESAQYVIVIMVVVAVIMLVMFGMLLSTFFHATQSTSG